MAIGQRDSHQWCESVRCPGLRSFHRARPALVYEVVFTPRYRYLAGPTSSVGTVRCGLLVIAFATRSQGRITLSALYISYAYPVVRQLWCPTVWLPWVWSCMAGRELPRLARLAGGLSRALLCVRHTATLARRTVSRNPVAEVSRYSQVTPEKTVPAARTNASAENYEGAQTKTPADWRGW